MPKGTYSYVNFKGMARAPSPPNPSRFAHVRYNGYLESRTQYIDTESKLE